jgi:hypothetical protein
MSNPFDYLNAINYTKTDMMVDPESEKQYKPFLINRGLSYFADTIMYSNEMNRYPLTENKLQFQYLLNSIRPRKRFSKWFKKVEDEDVDAIQEFFGYSYNKALRASTVLSKDEITLIKKKLDKGGVK